VHPAGPLIAPAEENASRLSLFVAEAKGEGAPQAASARDKAVISESESPVHHGPVVKGMRRVIIETDEGTRHEYSVPRSVHVNMQEGERVRAGDPLIEGPIDPHDVLAVLGIRDLQPYLVDKIQEVYRSRSFAINDKHIETICRQMLRSVRVTRVGDTDFLSINRTASKSIASASCKRTRK
jgi:DNA-directed RNA polymerase subunit beta'